MAKLDRLSRDVAFDGQKVPFIVAALGRNVNSFVLHIYGDQSGDRRG